MEYSSEGYVERKKFDPVYQIVVKEGNKKVIYVGKFSPVSTHTGLIQINGVETQGSLDSDYLDSLPKQEVLYPTNSILKITRLS